MNDSSISASEEQFRAEIEIYAALLQNEDNGKTQWWLLRKQQEDAKAPRPLFLNSNATEAVLKDKVGATVRTSSKTKTSHRVVRISRLQLEGGSEASLSTRASEDSREPSSVVVRPKTPELDTNSVASRGEPRISEVLRKVNDFGKRIRDDVRDSTRTLERSIEHLRGEISSLRQVPSPQALKPVTNPAGRTNEVLVAIESLRDVALSEFQSADARLREIEELIVRASTRLNEIQSRDSTKEGELILKISEIVTRALPEVGRRFGDAQAILVRLDAKIESNIHRATDLETAERIITTLIRSAMSEAGITRVESENGIISYRDTATGREI